MSITAYYLIGGIIVCLVCSAFFSASEMSFSSCNILRLENLKDEGNKKAKLAYYITQHFENALSTILIGNNLANIAGSSIGSLLLFEILGQERGTEYAWISTVVMTLLVIVFGETIPKISAKKNANRIALNFAVILRVLMIILFPLVWVIVTIIHLLSKNIKGSSEENSDEAVEELQYIIDTAEDEDVIDEECSELVKSAIDFSEISAYEVMTARVDMVAIDVDDDWDSILKIVEESTYSRLPVYENSIDNVIGILYLNHFLKALTENENTNIRELIMKPVYVYKTMKLPDVLAKLKAARQHLAIVSDEYGGVLGVVSMEDVLEQIVGEIWDETDEVEEEVVCRNANELELDGDMTVTDFLELIEEKEDEFEGESETVGGWCVEMIGDYPKKGDTFTYNDRTITILEAEGHRVEKILVVKEV